MRWPLVRQAYTVDIQMQRWKKKSFSCERFLVTLMFDVWFGLGNLLKVREISWSKLRDCWN